MFDGRAVRSTGRHEDRRTGRRSKPRETDPALERQRRALPAAVTIRGLWRALGFSPRARGGETSGERTGRPRHIDAHRKHRHAAVLHRGRWRHSARRRVGRGGRGRASDRADASRRRTNRHSWKSTGAKLAAMGYHVVALDSRGHGESDWSTDADYGIQTMATDVLNALSALGRPAVLVGASMGGLTSLSGGSTSWRVTCGRPHSGRCRAALREGRQQAGARLHARRPERFRHPGRSGGRGLGVGCRTAPGHVAPRVCGSAPYAAVVTFVSSL